MNTTQNPFFIIGTGRCGTKMLRRMLIRHRKIQILPETHWIPSLYDQFGNKKVEFHQISRVLEQSKFTRDKSWLELVLESADKSYSSFKTEFPDLFETGEAVSISEYMERFFTYLYGSSHFIIGDKTPHYGVTIPEITDIWPDSKFIHIIRDGVFCARSMTKHEGFRRQIGNNLPLHDLDRVIIKSHPPIPDQSVTVKKCMSFWKSTLNTISSKLKTVDQNKKYSVRYEDILHNPKKELTSILRFLGVKMHETDIKKGSMIPRPFSLKREVIAEMDNQYHEDFEFIQDMMEEYDYPIGTEQCDIAYQKRELKRAILRMTDKRIQSRKLRSLGSWILSSAR